jgi:hypothetical protein
VNYAEEIFKGAFFFEEVLNRLQMRLAKENIQREEEEKRKIAKEQFLLLLDKDKEKLEAKEEEEKRKQRKYTRNPWKKKNNTKGRKA